MSRDAILVTFTGWTLLAVAITLEFQGWSGLALWSAGITGAGLLWFFAALNSKR